MRTCTKCKVEYPSTSVYFPSEKARPKGLASWCRECGRILMKKYKQTKKGRITYAKAEQKYRQTQKGNDKTISDNMKWRYGISLEQYNKILNQQNNCCAICGKSEPKQRLAVDHCHNTGKVRGLLCTYCNLSLGVYENRKDEFEKYLSKGI